jgi:hypothetical protein
LSILFRTKGWLTLAQLLPAWASELADGKKDADQISRMNCRPHHSRARRRHRKSLGRTKDLRESKTPNELAGEQEAGDAEERSHALRQVRLLAQSREAARLDPRARRYAALGLIRASLPSTTCTVSEIFGATYGDPQGFDYWDAWLSEPLPIHTFVELLSVHRAAAEGAPRVLLSSVPVPVLDAYQRQIFEALRVASQSGETWFRRIGEPDIAVLPPDTALSPVAAQMSEGRYFVLLPREAIAWMAWSPNARHLLPDVTRVLCGAGGGSPRGHRTRETPQRGGRKSQPALERARGAIRELYPKGVPDQATEPNVNLCRRVSAKLNEAKLPNVSDDTILRAAGRRKERK